jgi:hypothetical protein
VSFGGREGEFLFWILCMGSGRGQNGPSQPYATVSCSSGHCFANDADAAKQLRVWGRSLQSLGRTYVCDMGV